MIAEEMGDWMTDNVTVIRENGKLHETEDEAPGAGGALEPDRPDRPERVTRNREISFVNQLRNMLVLARVMTRGALLREESRGAHYKAATSRRGSPRRTRCRATTRTF